MAHTTAAALQQEKHSELFWAFSNSWVLFVRSIKHITKNLDQLLSVAFQPIMFMLLFRYVFGGSINTGGTSYVNFLVAGILVQSAAFGATTTAISVATDMQRGIIDRFKSLPMINAAVLIGHTLSDLVRNAISSIIMIAVGFAVGFRPTASVGEWFLVFGMLMLFTLAFSWMSALLGLVAKSVEAVQWASFIVIFPITFASSAFTPTNGMPKYLKMFAENQPVTHVIEAIRAWMVGTPVGDHALWASVWCGGFLVISVIAAGQLFRRYSSR